MTLDERRSIISTRRMWNMAIEGWSLDSYNKSHLDCESTDMNIRCFMSYLCPKDSQLSLILMAWRKIDRAAVAHPSRHIRKQLHQHGHCASTVDQSITSTSLLSFILDSFCTTTMAEPRRSGRARKPVLNTFEADAPPPEIKPKASKRKPAAKKGKTAINEPPPGGQFPPITAAEDHPVDPDEALVLFNIPDAGSSTEVADSKPKAPTKKRGRPAANKTAEGSSKAGGEDGETVKPKKKGRTKKVDPNAERNARCVALWTDH